MSVRRSGVSLLLVFAICGWCWAGEPFAVISSLDGAASIERGGDSFPAELGMRLMDGDKIIAEDGAQVTVVGRDGRVMTVTGEPAVISAEPPAEPAIPKELASELADLPEKLEMGNTRGGVVLLGGLRNASGYGWQARKIPKLESPRNSVVLPSELHFSWSKVEGAKGYKLVVYGIDGLLWEGKVTETSAELPQDVDVKRGVSYSWRVEPILEFPDEVPVMALKSSFFTLITPEQEKHLQTQLAELEAAHKAEKFDQNTYHLLVGLLLQREGLLEKALEHYTTVAQAYPDQAMPYRRLAEVYAQMGLTDEALEAYGKTGDLKEE